MQSCSSLIRLLKDCGRCKLIFFLPALMLQYERSSVLLTPPRQNLLFEEYRSFPHLRAVYSRCFSLRLHRDGFFSSIYLPCFLGMQHPFSTANAGSMLASFFATSFQHFEKECYCHQLCVMRFTDCIYIFISLFLDRIQLKLSFIWWSNESESEK